jgi:hypothetical protein
MTGPATAYRHAHEVEGSVLAARRVVPHILDLLPPIRSIVDVGGGTGVWLQEFLSNGVNSGHLFDRSEVRDSLVVDPGTFHPCDLGKEVPALPRADLAVCIECAEHLPAARAAELVARLTAAADVVMFSAAIPLQGGTEHVNEQPPGYWQELFARVGFTRFDVVRQRIVHDRSIPYWYRQNLFLYARSADRLAAPPEPFLPDDFELVHRDILMRYVGPPGARVLLRHLVPQLIRAVAGRVSPWNRTGRS